jgi:hypothetical protein
LAYLHDFITRVHGRVRRYGQEVVPGRKIGEAIDIDRLIYPLRYDLCVRIDFIRLLSDQWALYSQDLDAFLERPQSRVYFIWFREIVCARYRPRIYRDEQLVKQAFVERVHETARVWTSIDQQGYDASTPIRLRSGRSIRSVNGKAITTTYFAGDGCHRMACLYLRGQTKLEPEQYEVQIDRVFEPLDNTATLARKIPLDRATYLKFISGFYCDGLELDSPDRIVQHVVSHKPGLLPELKSVLAFDLPRI